MPDRDEIEYKEVSEDWRHRDRLTWQIPSVLVIVGGMLLAAAYGYKDIPDHIRVLLLGIAAGLPVCLTVALGHNLHCQNINRADLEKICSGKRTLVKRRFGSWLLFTLCVIVTVMLIVVLLHNAGFICIGWLQN